MRTANALPMSRMPLIEEAFAYTTEIREPNGFADIETAIDELRAGRMIVVVLVSPDYIPRA